MLQRALVIYHREFLGGFDHFWANQRREELKLVQVDALSSLARLYEGQGMLEEAIGLYSRAFGINAQYEEAARVLMHYYVRTDQPARARKIFNHLAQELKKTQDIEPGAEILALADEANRALRR